MNEQTYQSTGWDDGMVLRHKNMFWEQEFFPGQNAPIDLALFYPQGFNI